MFSLLILLKIQILTSLPLRKVKFSLPKDLKANKEKLADLLRILKQILIILAKVADFKKTLKEIEKTKDPSNKLFILAEDLNENI
ncbi:hypothetical protein AVEN_61279-1 [Araneus ventricosus]|uniref:Uncharacterized protein n=1 Tax=Araneus ventricosus TaxID=182803 RepID=A0A4Y2SKI9_ARAVE|nr:hypothetical protein AVEN_61279-1 [Araneus ventricosus]